MCIVMWGRGWRWEVILLLSGSEILEFIFILGLDFAGTTSTPGASATGPCAARGRSTWGCGRSAGSARRSLRWRLCLLYLVFRFTPLDARPCRAGSRSSLLPCRCNVIHFRLKMTNLLLIDCEST